MKNGWCVRCLVEEVCMDGIPSVLVTSTITGNLQLLAINDISRIQGVNEKTAKIALDTWKFDGKSREEVEEAMSS